MLFGLEEQIEHDYGHKTIRKKCVVGAVGETCRCYIHTPLHDDASSLQASYSGLKDLLHPSSKDEARKHKLRRLVQSPNSFFMDVRCPGCYQM